MINGKMVDKTLFESAKHDAKRFCKRNDIYNTYDESVAKMIEKLYVTTYLRAFHQQSTRSKKIMKKLINVCCSYGATGGVTAEAEQFLKEI